MSWINTPAYDSRGYRMVCAAGTDGCNLDQEIMKKEITNLSCDGKKKTKTEIFKRYVWIYKTGNNNSNNNHTLVSRRHWHPHCVKAFNMCVSW